MVISCVTVKPNLEEKVTHEDRLFSNKLISRFDFELSSFNYFFTVSFFFGVFIAIIFSKIRDLLYSGSSITDGGGETGIFGFDLESDLNIIFLWLILMIDEKDKCGV